MTTLKQLSEEAQKLELLEQRIAKGTALLKELQAQKREIEERTIPDMMDELEMAEFTLTNGSKVEVQGFVAASIKVADRSLAAKWLRDNGEADLLKSDVTVKFSGGQSDDSDELVSRLEAEGLQVKQDNTVHPMTLKAWVKGKVEAGTELPDFFNVYLGRKIKIT